MVCHGGSGTAFGALAAGVPLVVCPLFADQPRNGEAVQSAGAGVLVASDQEAPGGLRGLGPQHVAQLRAAIEAVLSTPDYRRAAGRIAAEMAAVPTVDEVVGRLL